MDWARAKNILIILFLLMNIFLGSNIVYDKFMPSFFNSQAKDSVQILKTRGVLLECEIPNHQGYANRLYFEAKAGFDMDEVISKLTSKKVTGAMDKVGTKMEDDKASVWIDNNFSFNFIDKIPNEKVSIEDNKTLEKTAATFIKESGIPTKALILDEIVDAGVGLKSLTYVQKKGKFKQFDSCIVLLIGDKGVEQMSCTLPVPTYYKKDSDKIMPAYKVLLQNYLQNSNIVITSIELGYTMNSGDGDMKGFSEKLSWRIKTKDGKTRYFDAATGLPKNG